MGRIPDRWRDYSPCGKPIDNVPIVTFKTPLTHKFNSAPSKGADFVEEKDWFTPQHLVKCVQSMDRQLVVVVDLTNTARYDIRTTLFSVPFFLVWKNIFCLTYVILLYCSDIITLKYSIFS